MKTIIVPVDFSSASANAAEFAGNFAAFYGAEIWLYHAYELPVAIGEFAYPVFSVTEMQKAADHELEVFKENICSKLRTPVKINIRAEMNILQDGVEELCSELKPDLVVMGLSGKNTLTRLIVGSNTIRAIYQLKYPVLIVPPQAEFIPIRKIGFACDYQQVVQNTPIDLLKKITRDFHAELHVLNVDFHDRNFEPGMLHESFLLNELLGDIKAEYHNIESEDLTEGINWFAKKANLDWITVVPKKHQFVQRMFSRSHTKDLLFHTNTPVLCIHQ